MSIKNYTIINKKTNIVVTSVSHEESTVINDYDGFLVIDEPQVLGGVNPIAAGMLYYDNKFWLENTGISQRNVTFFSKSEFRKKFSESELISIDNFISNNSITDSDKNKLITLTKNIDSTFLINLEDSFVIDYVNFLKYLNLISDDTLNKILNIA